MENLLSEGAEKFNSPNVCTDVFLVSDGETEGAEEKEKEGEV